MKLAEFFSVIGFKIDDTAIKELQAKVKQANNAIASSAKQTGKVQKQVAQEMNSHVIAYQKQQQRVAMQEQRQLKEKLLQQRQLEREARASANRIEAHKRKVELESIRQRNRMEMAAYRKQAMASRSSQTFGTMASGATGLARNALAGYGVFELGRSVFGAAQTRAKTLAALTATSGGKENAAKEYEFLNREVDRLSLNLAAASEGFIKLKGSALGSKMAAEDVNKLFSATSELMTVYGASADDLEGAFRALGQMMSKTKITSEELKGQLSERMYGAVALTARAAGMDVPSLLKMMEKGNADAIKLLPKMADEFHKAAIEGNALNEALGGPMAKLNKLQTQWQRFLLKFADSGAMDVILNIFNDLSTTLVKLEPALPGIASALGTIFGALGKLVVLVANFVNWLEQTIGLENALYLFLGVKAIGWITALSAAVGQLIIMLKSLIGVSATAAAGMGSVLKGGATAGLLAKGGAVAGAGLAGYGIGTMIYDSADVWIQDQLAAIFGNEDKIKNITAPYIPTGMRNNYPNQKQEVVVKVHLDDNFQLKGKVEQIANDQLLAQILKAEAGLPGGR